MSRWCPDSAALIVRRLDSLHGFALDKRDHAFELRSVLGIRAHLYDVERQLALLELEKPDVDIGCPPTPLYSRPSLAHLHGRRATTSLDWVIVGFGDKATKDVYDGTDSKEARSIPKQIWNVAHRKLDMLNAARDLMDLRAAQGNRLEKLKGKLAGWWSIRVNDQYRVIFKFGNGTADAVQITDYH